MANITHMAATVTVTTRNGETIRCTTTQWERLHKPRGATLGDGKPPASKAKTPPTTDTQEK